MPRQYIKRSSKIEKIREYFGDDTILGNSIIDFNTNTYRTLTAYNLNKLYRQVIQEEGKEIKRRTDVLVAELNEHDERAFYMPNLENELKKYKGQAVRVIFDGELNKIDKVYDIPENNFRSFMRGNVYLDFQVDSEDNVFSLEKKQTGRIPPNAKIYVINNVEGKQKNQEFREGINNCLLLPINKWCDDKIDNSKTKKTKRKYTGMKKKLNALEAEYKHGVPENKIKNICETLQIGIDITLPLTDNKYISETSFKKPLRRFRFINTRLDHVDLNEVVCDDNTEDIQTNEEMKNIKQDLDDKGEFYQITRGAKKITSITTLNNKYILKSSYGKAVSDFEKETGLINCKLDHKDDYEVSNFVYNGTHYNLTRDFNRNRTDKINHIDMEKAYFNYKKCKYYNGFLGKITDFRKCSILLKKDGQYINGIYRITNISFDRCNKNTIKILKHLNCYKNGNIYPLPDLLFLIDIGITFNILEGCWGIENIDFDFPKSFLEKDEDKVKFYCKYVGSCNSINEHERIFMKGEKSLFDNLSYYTNEGQVEYNNYHKEGSICYKKKHIYHLSHITSFITSYQRVSTLDQLLLFDYNNILRVCVDGIYFYDECPELRNVFRVKDDINLGNEEADSYIDKLIEGDFEITENNFKQNLNELLCVGAGGTGKTHINLTDKGYIRKLFIAPSWKLARTKEKDYKCRVSVLARLISKDPEQTQRFKRFYNVLIFDEVSMYNKDDIKIIRNKYKSLKLIFCGDIDYQLPCISGTEIKQDDFKNIQQFNTNHRVEDKEFLKILKTVRTLIKQKKPVVNMIRYIRNHLKIIKDENINYDIEDFIICNTNLQKDIYTERFKGQFINEKFYITSNKYNGYSNGDIVITDDLNMNEKDYEIRHAFTIHSIQGETAEHKLFIKLDKIKSSRMLYTALSRARRRNQIFLCV